MANIPRAQSDYIISYVILRRCVGYIAICLPFVLALGAQLHGEQGLRLSISADYYSPLGDVFVGALAAIGVFLLSYRGPERTDDIAGDFACIFVIGVALFPTTPEFNPSSLSRVVGGVHLVCAAAFFITLAYFSLCLFTLRSIN